MAQKSNQKRDALQTVGGIGVSTSTLSVGPLPLPAGMPMPQGLPPARGSMMPQGMRFVGAMPIPAGTPVPAATPDPIGSGGLNTRAQPFMGPMRHQRSNWRPGSDLGLPPTDAIFSRFPRGITGR